MKPDFQGFRILGKKKPWHLSTVLRQGKNTGAPDNPIGFLPLNFGQKRTPASVQPSCDVGRASGAYANYVSQKALKNQSKELCSQPIDKRQKL